MASYTAINSVLLALEDFFKSRMPDGFIEGSPNPAVRLLSSADISVPITGNVLGIYMHRIEIDPHGRSRFFAPQGTGKDDAPASELPVNLRLLLVASGSSATIEANLISWAMIELANQSHLDISHLAENDDQWSESEMVTVTPEDMSTEDLMRIWEVFDSRYTSSVPYVVKTVRLRLKPQLTEGPAVTTRIFPTGIAETLKGKI